MAEMKADNDKWSDDLRKRMDGYEEPVDSGVWRAIKHDLDARESVPTRFRRAIISVAAVAACLIAAVGLYLYFTDRSTHIDLKDEAQFAARQNSEIPNYKNEKTAVAQSDANLSSPVKAKSVNSFAATEYHIASASELTVGSDKSVSGDATNAMPGDGTDNPTAVEAESRESQSVDAKEQRLSLYDTSGADFNRIKDSDSSESRGAHSNSRWSVSFSAGGNGIDSENETQDGFKPLQRSSIFGIQHAAASEAEEDFQYAYNEIVFNNIERDTRTEVEYDIPITYTASFRYNINDRWGVDAGLSFSKLGMQWKSGSDTHYYRQKQRMMFVGVPVSVSFTVLDTRFVSLYVLGGGSVEKCVSGSILTYLNDDNGKDIPSEKESINEHPWQYSVSAGAGVQFNITKNYGVFAEPKVAWYFDNAEKVDLRKDDGPYFNLNVGLRFTY